MKCPICRSTNVKRVGNKTAKFKFRSPAFHGPYTENEELVVIFQCRRCKRKGDSSKFVPKEDK